MNAKAFSIVRSQFSIILFSFFGRKSETTTLDGTFAWSLIAPEQQNRKLNLAVSAILETLRLSENERDQIRQAYVVAEDLALRQIEFEYGLPFFRHRMIEGVPFDAVAIVNQNVLCAEVVFLAKPEISIEQFGIVFKKAVYVNQRVGALRANSKALLLLVLVTQFSRGDEEKFQKTLRKYLHENARIEIDARLFNFDYLQHTFLS